MEIRIFSPLATDDHELGKTLDMLRCAFREQDVIAPPEYEALVRLLSKGGTIRGVAEMLAAAFRLPHELAYLDACGKGELTTDDAFAKTRERLVACGYEKWLRTS